MNSLEDYRFEGKLLDIKTYPDPVLKKVAEEVTDFGPELEELCFDMLYTMYNAPGIGLAAPQIGLSKRIFVMDIDYEREETELPDGDATYTLSKFNPKIFINPQIRDSDGEIIYKEGCLSVPGVYEEVRRYEHIFVDYQDVNGNHQTIEANELFAICIQHENDHLDGVLFIERLSNFKKNFYKNKLTKEKKKRVSE